MTDYKPFNNSFFKWSDKIDSKKDKNGNLYRSYSDTCKICNSAIIFIIYDKEDNTGKQN